MPNFKGFAKRIDDGTPPRSTHPVDVIADTSPVGRLIHLPIASIRANPNQPRKHFDPQLLQDLADSIREHGVLQPVLVRSDPQAEGYILIAGERRFRAASIAGLEKLPAIIRPEENHRELALIENLQRQNLNPIEEAEAFLELKETRGFTDETLAKILGKPRTTITETLALTRLPAAMKEECRTFDSLTKHQLLNVMRAGSPEKMASLWDALKSGEIRSVREIKSQVNEAKGRRSNYRFSYRDESGVFSVNVSFAKPEATPDDVKAALLAAAESLTGHE